MIVLRLIAELREARQKIHALKNDYMLLDRRALQKENEQLREGLDKVLQQDRMRGCPSGPEWLLLVGAVSDALGK